MIDVTIKLFATLREGRFAVENRRYESGSSVAAVLRDLGIPEQQAALILVNGRHADSATRLNDQDTVAIFPPIGGG